MNPRISSQDYEGFMQKIPIEERRELRKSVTKWQKYFEPAVNEKLIENIDTDIRHHNLVKLCAKSFAGTDLSKKSGYEFYFAEPLIEFGAIEEDNKSFDLFLFDENKQSAIFVECKSSIQTRAKKIIKEVVNATNLVENNLDYLSRIVGVPVELESIEYVLCVYDKDSKKIIDSLSTKASKDERIAKAAQKIKLWIYRPNSQRIQLYQNHVHSNSNLTNMLLEGFGEDNLKSQFELPYCITTHPYRIFKLAIIGDCYAKNVFYENVEDPKMIKITTILDTLEKNISLGMPQEQKKELISEKLDKIITFGERYQLLEMVNEEEIRLICRGNDIQVVKNNIEHKFRKNWIQEHSEFEAERKAIEEHKKKTGRKQIKDYY